MRTFENCNRINELVNMSHRANTTVSVMHVPQKIKLSVWPSTLIYVINHCFNICNRLSTLLICSAKQRAGVAIITLLYVAGWNA